MADDAGAVLREGEALYRLIVEGARDYAIFTTDPCGRIVSWSPGAESVFGWSAPEVIGQDAAVLFLPGDRAAGEPEKELRTAREAGWAPDVRWHQRQDGSRVFIDGHTRPLRDAAGALRGFLKIGQDVTRRRELDQALRESEQRFRALADLSPDGILVSLDDEVVYANRAALALLGEGDQGKVLSRSPFDFIVPEKRELVRARMQRAVVASEPVPPVVVRWRRPDGSAVEVEVAGGATVWDGRRALQMLLRDLTERRRAEALLAQVQAELKQAGAEHPNASELAIANEVLATQMAERAALEETRDELARRLVAAEEQERRRLSRELHDQMGQLVTALLLGLRSLEKGAASVAPALADLESIAEQIAREVHNIAAALRPPALDRLGLRRAIEAHLQEWSDRYGVPADFHAVGLDEERFSPEVETALYRAAQEGLSNVAKHAGATAVNLVLERRGGSVAVILEDDGRGFDVADVTGAAHGTRRLGLLGMQERMRLLGGNLDIESTPGGGTTLFARLPDRAALGGPEADE